jgi:hypothetical protein
MVAPDPSDDLPAGTVLSRKLNAEQRAALEYLRALFPEKYGGLSTVLDDYSVNQAVATYRRAQELAAAS